MSYICIKYAFYSNVQMFPHHQGKYDPQMSSPAKRKKYATKIKLIHTPRGEELHIVAEPAAHVCAKCELPYLRNVSAF